MTKSINLSEESFFNLFVTDRLERYQELERDDDFRLVRYLRNGAYVAIGITLLALTLLAISYFPRSEWDCAAIKLYAAIVAGCTGAITLVLLGLFQSHVKELKEEYSDLKLVS